MNSETENVTTLTPTIQPSQSPTPEFEALRDCIDYFKSQGMCNLEIKGQCGLPS